LEDGILQTTFPGAVFELWSSWSASQVARITVSHWHPDLKKNY
jgi:hypothetical protein